MTRTAGIYVRLSSDPEGNRLGVTRQLADCQTRAHALGWTVQTVFEDNDRSASTGKVRPAYQQMLSDLEVGRINAVVVWDLDRLTRRPIEIEAFIDLADRRGITLASVGGDVDLATDNGRMFARIKGAVARGEVERKSVRQKSANAQKASAGKPHGGRRAFGYSADGLELVETEAAEVRKAVYALLTGASVHGITRDLNARGVSTSTGGVWHTTEVRRMIGNPRYAALREYNGETLEGKWPAVIGADEHHAVRAVLSDPRRHRAGAPRRYLLTGVATCAVCGAGVFGVTEKTKAPLYRCESRRHIHRQAEPVDDVVVKTVVGRLAMPNAADLLVDRRADEQVRDLRDRQVGLRARLDGLAEAFAAGEIDRTQLRKGTERLQSEMQAASATLDSLARTPLLGSLLGAKDVRAAWEELDVDRQRAIIDALVTVRIHPPGRGARTLDPRTVVIDWRKP